MRQTVLSEKFFERSTVPIARDILGKFLVLRQSNGNTIAKMITEVEAYDGFKDKASHAVRGKTKRNAPMFEKGGIWYVYLIYGMYDMLNIVTGPKGYPAALLIRGVEYVSGPGKLTKLYGIDRKYNGLLADTSTGLWIEDRRMRIPVRHIIASPRIGVEYAGPVWAKKRYRFFICGGM